MADYILVFSSVSFLISVVVAICLLSNKRTKKKTASKVTQTHIIVWVCLVNGILWVWCSYALAWAGRDEIAKDLSQTAIIELIGTVLVYCLKSLFEKTKAFGSVGSKEVDVDNYGPDERKFGE